MTLSKLFTSACKTAINPRNYARLALGMERQLYKVSAKYGAKAAGIGVENMVIIKQAHLKSAMLHETVMGFSSLLHSIF